MDFAQFKVYIQLRFGEKKKNYFGASLRKINVQFPSNVSTANCSLAEVYATS